MPASAPNPSSRDAVTRRLRAVPAEDLAAVLVGAGLRPAPDASAAALAEQLTAALWWRTHSPVGQLVLPASLDQLVDRIARKLDLSLPEGDAWARLDALTRQLLPGGRLLEPGQLDPATRARLRKRLWPAWTGVVGGAGAAGGQYAALKLLAWTQGPLWELLPWIPHLGPAFLAARKGALLFARVSAPVGVVLALFSLNQALGPEDDRALPLLLGVGLVVRDLDPVADAEEVAASAPAEPGEVGAEG